MIEEGKLSCIMQNYDFEQIESITSTIHETMNAGNSTFVNVVGIARQLDFHVFESNFTQNDIDGLVINSASEKSIYVNQDNSPVRQRFTISHELGHIVLHHNEKSGDYQIVDYRGNNNTYDPKEHEANIFAASLLMPKNKAIEIWNSLHDVDDFAKAFQVSKVAAAIRLQNLGLIQ